MTAHLIWAIFDNCLWKIYRLKLKLPRKSVKLMNQIKHNWPRTLLEWSENDCRYYALICLLNCFCCKHRSFKKIDQNQQMNTRFSLKFIKRSDGEIWPQFFISYLVWSILIFQPISHRQNFEIIYLNESSKNFLPNGYFH